MNHIVVNEPNKWRLETPGSTGWQHSPRPNAAKKYYMVSADCHANEPAILVGGDQGQLTLGPFTAATGEPPVMQVAVA